MLREASPGEKSELCASAGGRVNRDTLMRRGWKIIRPVQKLLDLGLGFSKLLSMAA